MSVTPSNTSSVTPSIARSIAPLSNTLTTTSSMTNASGIIPRVPNVMNSNIINSNIINFNIIPREPRSLPYRASDYFSARCITAVKKANIKAHEKAFEAAYEKLNAHPNATNIEEIQAEAQAIYDDVYAKIINEEYEADKHDCSCNPAPIPFYGRTASCCGSGSVCGCTIDSVPTDGYDDDRFNFADETCSIPVESRN